MRIPTLLPAVLLGTIVLAPAEVEKEIPLGVEVVTGLRSDYLHRGFHLAGTTLDAQAESEIALRDDLILTLGGWLASELNEDFSEVGGSFDLRKSLNDLTLIGGSFTYQSRKMSPLGDGQDLSIYLQIFPTQDWDLKVLASRDFESKGWYTALEGGWSRRINDDSFLSISSGLSWVDAYYARDGLNDFYGRASFTYVVNQSVSITPFAGWSVLMDEDDPGTHRVFAGLWFEVVF